MLYLPTISFDSVLPLLQASCGLVWRQRFFSNGPTLPGGETKGAPHLSLGLPARTAEVERLHSGASSWGSLRILDLPGDRRFRLPGSIFHYSAAASRYDASHHFGIAMCRVKTKHWRPPGQARELTPKSSWSVTSLRLTRPESTTRTPRGRRIAALQEPPRDARHARLTVV